MAYRNLGFRFPEKTTAELADMIVKYGPTGTTYVNAIAAGTMVRDKTTGVLMTYNGLAWVAGVNII